MRKEKKSKHFLHKPNYPGGLAAIREFIAKNLVYPVEALKEKIEGSVYLRYEIDYRGVVTGVKVVSSLGYGCDEEAARVVKLLKFKVEKTRGLKVLFHKNIRIHYNLPPAKPPKTETQVNYSYSTSSQKQNSKKENPGQNYGYTIRY